MAAPIGLSHPWMSLVATPAPRGTGRALFGTVWLVIFRELIATLSGSGPALRRARVREDQ